MLNTINDTEHEKVVVQGVSGGVVYKLNSHIFALLEVEDNGKVNTHAYATPTYSIISIDKVD